MKFQSTWNSSLTLGLLPKHILLFTFSFLLKNGKERKGKYRMLETRISCTKHSVSVQDPYQEDQVCYTSCSTDRNVVLLIATSVSLKIIGNRSNICS